MRYLSTRGGKAAACGAEAIVSGIAPDGGLYVPETIPVLTEAELAAIAAGGYMSAAGLVFSKFLDDFPAETVARCIGSAYRDSFDAPDIAPVVPLSGRDAVMELWHGPTAAFKDVALQALPHLMRASLDLLGDGRHAAILVATSGDTGKAALEGFASVPGMSVTVLYPDGGVSPLQRKQMVTQRGGNVAVIGVRGNFDDAQTAAKRLFADGALKEALARDNALLSSANSINWGRLLPQIVYYVRMAAGHRIPVDCVVPTGNFGNILAAFYAKRMGANIGRLVCASNRNDVLTVFLRTGVYDRNRALHSTLSPSMDILVSSNLERLLFELGGRDAAEVRRCMDALAREGRYTVGAPLRKQLTNEFSAYAADDAAARAAIARAWREHGYLANPHTAVALDALMQYRADGASAQTVAVSTASPCKFPRAVLESIGVDAPEDEFACLRLLEEKTGCTVPAGVRALETLPELHREVCGRDEAIPRVKARLFELIG